MIYNKVFSIFSILSSYSFFDYGSALSIEGIIGGYYAYSSAFRYQVAIVGKRNHSNVNELLGGGAIISESFVLSAAQCFIDINGILLQFRFLIIAGSLNLKQKKNVQRDVDIIYIPNYTDSIRVNDIAVLKLATKFMFGPEYFPRLEKINISLPLKTFAGKLGVVSGYGYNSFGIKRKSKKRKSGKIVGNTTHILKYAFYKILNESMCQVRYYNIKKDRQICARMIVSHSSRRWGLCLKDIGNPLVIEKTLVGLVNWSPRQCDDTFYGSIFTKVPSFLFFIELILEGSNPNGIIYINRPHIQP